MSSSPPILLRQPRTVTNSAPDPDGWVCPPHDFLLGTWHVTHSTLPFWRSKKNVCITYTLLPSVGASSTEDPTAPYRLDDLVTYHPMDHHPSARPKTIKGVDTSHGEDTSWWGWKGKGLLGLLHSEWEILGCGKGWAVTYFSKTWVTPAGVDIYSRSKEGVPAEVLEGIKKVLVESCGEDIAKLLGELRPVVMDQV